MTNKNYQNIVISFFASFILIVSSMPLIFAERNYIDPTKNSITIQEDFQHFDLLILCPDEFSNQLQSLVNHKEKYGVSTKLETLSKVYEEMYWYGRDNAEKIKFFIKNSFDNWAIEYVLLVGSYKKMPVRYIYNQDVRSGFNEPFFISELYYADIYDSKGNFSSWDTDGDGIFGEWIDDGISTQAEDKDIDLYPDVYVGRLACRNSYEVKIMVNKIINYESKTYGNNWFNKIVVAAGDTYPKFPGNEGEENTLHVLENMSAFTPVTLWASDGSLKGPWDIISALNKGCGFLYFDGHANPFKWSTHPPEDKTTWINGLSLLSMSLLFNGLKLPVCVVGGCHNNQFDVNFEKIFEDPFAYFTWIPECWGWKLTRKIGGGTIATIGCTGLGMTKEDKDSFSGAGDYLEPTFFWEYGVNGTQILGEAWGKTITNYLKVYPIDWNTPAAWDSAIDAKTVQQWALLGDPSLKIGGYANN